MKQGFILISIIGVLFITSCSKPQKKEEITAVADSLITITRQQFETDKMVIGPLQKLPFFETVKCNGKVTAKATGTAKIAAMVPGLVNRILCVAGQKVSKGQSLFELSGNELIELQRDYAESASQLKKLKSEYERVKSLFSENVGTQKELISAESEFKAVQAKYAALKLKIGIIGLDANKIENGDFYTSYFIKSPINGYISLISMSIGQHADEEVTMAEVIDASQFQLHLAVFEKDISQLITGQKVHFSMLDNLNNVYSATLQNTGKTVDPESKTIVCYASIDDLACRTFVNNEYVEANIIIKTDTVFAASAGAVLKSGEDHYLLKMVKKDGADIKVEKVKVKTGRLMNNYFELMDPVESGNYIVSGSYNVVIN